MANDQLGIDPNGRNSLGGIDDSNDEVRVIKADGTSYSLRVNNWVWNTTTLAWERMQQPTIEYSGDLTVTMGDVERLLAGTYWQKVYIEDTGTSVFYFGANDDISAADADTDWHVTKLETGTSPMTVEYQPGAWSGRHGLF